MYSALFGISRLTTSPLPTPVAVNKRAARFTAASNSAKVNRRPSASEKGSALSGAALTRCSQQLREILLSWHHHFR